MKTAQAEARRDAEAAFAVFEEAHAPTDDEREVLIDIVAKATVESWDSDDGTANTVTDRVLAAGFRRPVSPESAAEPRITIEHENGNTVTGTPEQVLNHGHLKPGWRCRASEPQAEPTERLMQHGEPTDAQAKKFGRYLFEQFGTGIGFAKEWTETGRAALRAASPVQGESR
jgi:hypothetical protein